MNNSIDPNSQNYLTPALPARVSSAGGQNQSNNDNWIRYNKSPHSLITSSFELKKAWTQKEYLKTFQNLFIFFVLVWMEIKDSFFSHLLGFPTQKKELSTVQRWFYSSTGGESSSLLGWITFYSWLYTQNFIKYRKNELRGSIKSKISSFSSLPQFESISAKIFILATFCAAFQAYNLSQPTAPVLYIRKNKAAFYQELLPAPQEFKKSSFSLRMQPHSFQREVLTKETKLISLVSDINFDKAKPFSESLARNLLSNMVSLKIPSSSNEFSFARYFSQEYKTDLSKFIKFSDGKLFINKKTFKPVYDKLSKPTQKIYQSITRFGKIDLTTKDFLSQKYNLFKNNTEIGDLKIASSHLFVIKTPLFPHLLADYNFENSKTLAAFPEIPGFLSASPSATRMSFSPSSSDLHISEDPIYSFINFDWLPIGQKRLNLGLTTYQNQLKKIVDPVGEERNKNVVYMDNKLPFSGAQSTVSSGLFWLSEIYPQKDINFFIYSCSIFSRSFIPLFSIYVLSILFELLNSSMDELDSGVNSFVPSSVKVVGSLVNKKRLSNILGIEALLPDLKELLQDLSSVWTSSAIKSNKPKGYLFIGPPGTGKTKLAEAIAGEGNVTFIATSAAACLTSSSALNIRTLFYQARQLAPCILFIDEIDSFGLSRQDLF